MNGIPIYGLVCAGGGAHGAYQVGVLKYIHEHFCVGSHSPFKIYAGSSCGALNTSFFAANSHNAKDKSLYLDKLWKEFHIPHYHGSMAKNLIRSLIRKKGGSKESHDGWALLDPKPMKAVIKNGFRTEDLQEAFHQKTTLGVAVSAIELLSSRMCWFLDGPNAVEWNLFHSIGMKTQLTGDHIQASCSIPFFLPPVKIDGRFYSDGSVGLARPMSAAISMGATKILRIAAEKPLSSELPDYHPSFRPKLSHVVRMLIHQLTRDSATDEAIQIEKLNQFYNSLKIKESNGGDMTAPGLPIYHEEHRPDDYRPIDLCLFYPSKRINKSPAFSSPKGKKIKGNTTRFMFHRKFITELISFGYDDAKSKHEELEKFFSQESSKDRRWFIFAKN